jgi:ABC-type transport system involved in multi-copper enzyme maturation permease subunit
MRALILSGISARSFMWGKLGAAIVLSCTLVIVSLCVAIVPALWRSEESIPLVRIVLLVLVYAAALLSFAFLVSWFSARLGSSHSAFSATAFAWLFTALLCPVLAGQLATTMFPDVDEQVLKNDIQLKAQTPFWVGDAQESAVIELGEKISPLLAASRISSGVSGTDLMAQLTFARQAEAHRRLIIKQLNDDMMINSGGQAFEYMADEELWKKTPDFEQEPLPLGSVLIRYWFESIALISWLIATGFLAYRAIDEALSGDSRHV